MDGIPNKNSPEFRIQTHAADAAPQTNEKLLRPWIPAARQGCFFYHNLPGLKI